MCTCTLYISPGSLLRIHTIFGVLCSLELGHLHEDDGVLLGPLRLGPGHQVRCHGVLGPTLPKGIPNNVEAETRGASLGLTGGQQGHLNPSSKILNFVL